MANHHCVGWYLKITIVRAGLDHIISHRDPDSGTILVIMSIHFFLVKPISQLGEHLQENPVLAEWNHSFRLGCSLEATQCTQGLVIITTKLCLLPAFFNEAASARAPGAHVASQKCVAMANSVVWLSLTTAFKGKSSGKLVVFKSNPGSWGSSDYRCSCIA